MTQTLRLESLLELAVQAGLGGFYTALPGKVVAFDEDQCFADVQPMVRKSFVDEFGERQSERYPIVPWCPVYFMGGSAGRITVPVKAGDMGLLVMTSCSLDQLLITNSEVDPQDDRRNTLTDAYFLHGVHTSTTRPDSYSGDDVVIDATNLLRLGGLSANESAMLGTSFINALNTFLTALNTFAGTVVGPTTPQLTAFQTALSALQSGDFLSGKVVLQ